MGIVNRRVIFVFSCRVRDGRLGQYSCQYPQRREGQPVGCSHGHDRVIAYDSFTEVAVKPERVSFRSYPGIFRVEDLCCDHIECPCTSIWFNLTEVLARNRIVKPPIRISVKVDALTWQELEAPQRPPEFEQVVAEFLRDYPQVERDFFKEWFLERQSVVAKLSECVVDPDDVESGMLFDFFEILGLRGEHGHASSLGRYTVEHSGVTYHALERFCLNPGCLCNEALLSFFHPGPNRGSQGQAVMKEMFQAVLTLDGTVRMHEVFDGDEALASRVLAKWEKEHGHALEHVAWRYEKMKEIGSRSLAAAGRATYDADAPPEPIRRSPDRVGRNDPCPCGSGKKYKKCCARSARADS